MPSELKSETARVNGAKSRGPSTPAGLSKSSGNALKHGLTANNHILLAGEDPAAFQEMLDEYVVTYQPKSIPERDLVAEIVGARWRLRRLETIESGLLDDEMLRRHTSLARSFRTLADDSRALDLSSRYQSRLHRIHDKAYQTLCHLQQARENKQPTEIRVSWVDKRTDPDDSEPIQNRDRREADPCAQTVLPNEPTAAEPTGLTEPVLPHRPLF